MRRRDLLLMLASAAVGEIVLPTWLLAEAEEIEVRRTDEEWRRLLTPAARFPASRRPVRGLPLRRFIRTGGGRTGQYYESIDLIDAFHPQIILAHSLNDVPLSVGHGAPLRLRVERQLGYKHAKYVMRIELTDRLDRFGRGKGGFWPDRGYEWYAGI